MIDTKGFLKQLHKEREHIDQLITAIGGTISKTLKPKRKLSAKARKAIGDAQRKRWKAHKAAAKSK